MNKTDRRLLKEALFCFALGTAANIGGHVALYFWLCRG